MVDIHCDQNQLKAVQIQLSQALLEASTKAAAFSAVET
jgi:hypothetical protein